jgi:hypothetical protein
MENIWPGVDPNILATGGATTGYASTGRQVPRSNPGDLSSNPLKTCFIFSDLLSDAKFYRKRQHQRWVSLKIMFKRKFAFIIFNYKNINFKSRNSNVVHCFPISLQCFEQYFF